jgi:hypothetical protein
MLAQNGEVKEMSQRKVQFRRIEPKYESVHRSGLMRDLFANIGEEIAFRSFFEEYEIDWNLPELPEEDKEAFRQHPEKFLRNMLAENGFDPINAVAVRGDPEECLKKRDDTALNSANLIHVTKPPSLYSTYVIK